MFNVIRIPTKFSRTIKRFSEKEKAELLGMLIKIWDWEKINIPDSIVWDTLNLIYWEWMNMESKNWNKPKDTLIIDNSDILAINTPSNPDSRVEYSRVEESRIEENRREKNLIKIKNEYWNGNVYLSKEEYNKIKERYGVDILEKFIEKLSLYILKLWKDKYKSHYAVILEWIRKDNIQELKENKPIDWNKIYS